MPKYIPLHPDTEIKGQMMIDFEQAVGSEHFLPIMHNHGLSAVDADGWYPIQTWLDVLEEIEASSTFLDLISIGMQQIENVNWPPDVLEMTLVDFLTDVVNDIYRAYYRGKGAGSIQVERVSSKNIKVIVRVPEPDSLWYGNLYAISQKWLPTEAHPIVEYAEPLTRRDFGAAHTVFRIKTVRPSY